MLKQYEKLLFIHESSKIDHHVFQPMQEEQKKLIVKGITHRLISLAMKRESTKYLFSQRLKLDEVRKKLQAEGIANQIEAANSTSGGYKPGNYRIFPPKTSSKANTNKTNNRSPSKSPQKLAYLKRRSSASVFQDTSYLSSKMLEFAKVLKTIHDADRVITELNILALDQLKDSKKVFDYMSRGYDQGRLYQLNPKRLLEEIDLSEFGTTISLATVTKIEDLNQMKKKDGLLIFLDPSTNTKHEPITIRIRYMKAIDLTTEEEVTKEYTLWSNGNYFGLSLQREAVRGASPTYSPLSGNSPRSNSNNQGSRGRPTIGLPGWQGRNPIFIPATKCKFEILHLEQYSRDASLLNNLTRLKFYVLFATGIKSGLRRLNDFLERYLLQETANIILPGGMSALNYACLHGNLEAVQRLVACGAQVNTRCKSDHYCSPLHAAVTGRNVEVVAFLLSQGANQLVKDDKGNCPLHYACKMGETAIVRIFIESSGGRRALVMLNNLEQKPIDVCDTHYIRSKVETVMRKHRIFVAPRISILDR